MNGTKKIITIIGIIIISVSVGFGAYMVYQKGLIANNSDVSIKPTKIKVTNVGADRFTVSWITSSPTKGSIIYGLNGKPSDIQPDDSDQLTNQSQLRKVHHVTVTNLKPATPYAYRVRSGEKNNQFDNSGEPFIVKTAPTLGSQPASDLISGTVMTSDNKPATNAIVYVTITGMVPLSTQVKNDGSWLLSLSSARNAQLTDYAQIDPATTPIEIFVQGDSSASQGSTNSANDSPVPQIILGQTFDFTKNNNVAITNPITPNLATESAIVKPEETNPIAGQFPVTPDSGTAESTASALPAIYQQGSAATAVTITYPAKDNEKITSLRPEIKGTGPARKVLTLTISAVKPITGTVPVDQNGRWSYSPMSNLSSGNHVLSIDYLDSEGVQQKVKRQFVIAASNVGGTSSIPAFVATPSASSSAKPVTRASMPSTSGGIPHSGVSLPTFGLLFFGLLLISSGIYAKVIKSDE